MSWFAKKSYIESLKNTIRDQESEVKKYKWRHQEHLDKFNKIRRQLEMLLEEIVIYTDYFEQEKFEEVYIDSSESNGEMIKEKMK